MQRKARSRSDAPIFIVCIGEPVSIIGTIGICTTTIIDTDTGITGLVVTIGFTSTGIMGTSTGIMGTGTIIMRGTGSRVPVDCRDARLMSGRA